MGQRLELNCSDSGHEDVRLAWLLNRVQAGPSHAQLLQEPRRQTLRLQLSIARDWTRVAFPHGIHLRCLSQVRRVLRQQHASLFLGLRGHVLPSDQLVSSASCPQSIAAACLMLCLSWSLLLSFLSFS